MSSNDYKLTETLMLPRRRAGITQHFYGLAQFCEQIDELLLKVKDQITRFTLWSFQSP
jgi:hypothetical protein